MALLAAGCVARLGYIDRVTTAELADCMAAGVLFAPITYALEYDGAHTLSCLKSLGLPQGVTVWLDVEGQGLTTQDTIAKINAWAAAVVAAGFIAGLYVGAGCPLSSDELSALPNITRYWRSCSDVRQIPARGYCLDQLPPDDVIVCGVKVDVSIVRPDWRGDLPTFVAP